MEEKYIKKFGEIMEIAKKSKVDFYTSGGKRGMEVRAQKKPLEDFAYIVTNLLILEKLESIEKLLSPEKKEDVTDNNDEKEEEVVQEKDIKDNNDEKKEDTNKKTDTKKKAGRPATKK